MIIASVVTIPNRLDLLFESLDELLNSTLRPDFLYVSVAEYYPRLNQSYPTEDLKKLKSRLQEYEISNQLVIYPEDEGPIFKLKTPLTQHKTISNDDLIFIFDDDTYIFDKAIQILDECKRVSGNYAIYCLIGVGFDSKWFLHGEYIQGGDYYPIKLMGGYRGVLYPMCAIDREDFLVYLNWVVDEFKKIGTIPMHDDHIYSMYCLIKNIPMRLANIKEKITNTDGSVLYYRGKETHNGIMQSQNQVENYYKFFELINSSGFNIEPF